MPNGLNLTKAFSNINNSPGSPRRVMAFNTLMYDLIEKRLASMVDRPCARQLWAMKPSFSSARQIASSPSFQFQLGMFRRWAWKGGGEGRVNAMKRRKTTKKTRGEKKDKDEEEKKRNNNNNYRKSLSLTFSHTDRQAAH